MPQQQDFLGFSHQRELRVEWGHCDPAGIVFHPRFIEYFDWGCVLLIEASCGKTQQELKSLYGLAGIPIVGLECEFLDSVRAGQLVQITAQFIDVGTSSFQLLHTLTLDGKVVVTCRQKRVWCIDDPNNLGGLKGGPIPTQLSEIWRAPQARPLPTA